ncbi:cysteine protein inhibitor 5-like [Dorcoceras hygrometricum]|uniref:Cysteine protein inhibitor 5-like n=1 Tax=Dorcoceras hygrometricum TaxID=472368 RepID=A0A2Z7A3C7_9LAMI|nr:cysteine protein inhibitor 5-like [Dorcoceras hygrometricum]
MVSCIMASKAADSVEGNPPITGVIEVAEFAVEEYNRQKKADLELVNVVDEHVIGCDAACRKPYLKQVILVIRAIDHGHADKYGALLWLDAWPAPRDMKLVRFKKRGD